jgi:PAS domain S-box-containing protein
MPQRPAAAQSAAPILDERCLQAVAESASDMIAVLDADGRRLYVNPALADLLGGAQRLIGSDSLADVHPDDRPRLRELLRCYERRFSAGERQALLDDIRSAVGNMTRLIERLFESGRSAG